MALEQAMTLKNTLIFYQNRLRQISLSPYNLSLNPTKPRFSSIKSTFDYNNNNNNSSRTHDGLYEYERYAVKTPSNSPQYAKPTEIQWKKELCNSVQLIGIVGAPVQIKQLSSGKVLAWSCLAVKKSQTDTSWINLTFWNDLANIAFEHVEKGQQVYVSGRLVSDTVESEDGKQQTYYKVVVQELNFIERGSSSIPLYNGDSNSTTPSKKQNNYAVNSTGTPEELWQAFFANPLEWWDNRKNKRSPKHPDFKHKDTGEALWVDGRNNPSWVKSQLSVLDSRMESYNDQNSSNRVNFMDVNSLGPF